MVAEAAAGKSKHSQLQRLKKEAERKEKEKLKENKHLIPLVAHKNGDASQCQNNASAQASNSGISVSSSLAAQELEAVLEGLCRSLTADCGDSDTTGGWDQCRDDRASA